MHRRRVAGPPAIVLGRGYTGLGALRCLAMAGIAAHVACPRGDLATHSRWYRPPPGAAWDGTPDADALRILQDMPVARAVLIPGADNAARWLAELPPALAPRFAHASAPRGALEILQDKQRFAAYLADTDIAHPRTFAIADAADIAALPLQALDRVFLKPTDSQRFGEIFGVKGLWASGPAQLEAQWRRAHAAGCEVVAQEYVPGRADDHYFVDGYRDRDGRLTGLFARRRVRIFPPDFGNSAYCVGIPLREVPQAVDDIARLLTMLDYRGIFSAEFKRDRRCGTFRLLEVNTRAWWYVEFAARCGVNVCAMAYHDALGEPVPQAPRRYRSGIGCANFVADVQAVLRTRPRPSPPRLLWQWTRACFHVFRIDDPRPFLAAFGKDLRRWWAARRRRSAGVRAAPEAG